MAAGQWDVGLLVVRVAVGATMIAHGYNHIYRGGKIKGTAGWFASLGMKPGILHAWLASLTELAAGAGLVVGLLTPLAAGAIIGTLTVAFITNHRNAGFFVFRRPTEGWEYLMNLIAACVRDRVSRARTLVARQRDRFRAPRMGWAHRDAGDRRRRRSRLARSVLAPAGSRGARLARAVRALA